MPLILITLILNQVNASSFPIQDGWYTYEKLGVVIDVKNGEAVFAKIYEDTIPLTKKENTFYGEIQKQGQNEQSPKITTSIEINGNNKKSLLVKIEEQIITSIGTGSGIFRFKDLGIDLTVENNSISTLRTGLDTKTNATELKLDSNGAIESYSVYSRSPYILQMGNSEIEFVCEGCSYTKTIGPKKSSIEIVDSYRLTFTPRTIEIYAVDEGIKKTINTSDGKSINTEIFFYNNSDLLSSSTQFSIDEDKIIYKNAAKLITRKTRKISPELL